MNTIPLPPLVDSFDLIANLGEPPQDIWKGVFGSGSKGVLGGASKTFKTWLAADLAFCVAYGLPCLGFDTVQGRVLVLNLELQDYFYGWRLREIAQRRKIKLEKNRLVTWNLRGHAKSYDMLLDEIGGKVAAGGYSLVELDPIYKILGDAVENDATDITKMLNRLELFSLQTKASTFFTTHFPKGNPALKESIDRISGSGVFARDPDTIITITRHKNDNCFTMDFTLRNHSPIKPFVIRWDYPIMVRDDGIDPGDIKTPHKGRPELYETSELLAILPSTGLSFTDWYKASKNETGISKTAFAGKLQGMITAGKINKDKGVWTRRIQEVEIDLETSP